MLPRRLSLLHLESSNQGKNLLRNNRPLFEHSAAHDSPTITSCPLVLYLELLTGALSKVQCIIFLTVLTLNSVFITILQSVAKSVQIGGTAKTYCLYLKAKLYSD